MKKEKREQKTKKEHQEIQKEIDKNYCLSSLPMPLWFYRLYRYAFHF